jgi:hypothetical protein
MSIGFLMAENLSNEKYSIRIGQNNGSALIQVVYH